MSTLVIGIDPGVTGAAAAILDGEVQVHDAPTFLRKGSDKRRFSIAGAAGLIGAWVSGARRAGHDVRAYLELAMAMPSDDAGGRRGMGATSAFGYGEGFGAWQGIFAALDVQATRVAPGKWKRDMGLGRDKRESIRLAISLYPQLATILSRVKDNGRAEAVLLARYGLTELGLEVATAQPPTAPPVSGEDLEF